MTTDSSLTVCGLTS